MADTTDSGTESLHASFSAVEAFSVDEAFDALADPRRRTVVECLRGRGGWTELPDVAAEVASRERGDVREPEVRAVSLSLYHVHVPKLAAAEIVHFDPETETLRLSEDAAQLNPILDLAAE